MFTSVFISQFNDCCFFTDLQFSLQSSVGMILMCANSVQNSNVGLKGPCYRTETQSLLLGSCSFKKPRAEQ